MTFAKKALDPIALFFFTITVAVKSLDLLMQFCFIFLNFYTSDRWVGTLFIPSGQYNGGQEWTSGDIREQQTPSARHRTHDELEEEEEVEQVEVEEQKHQIAL